MGKSVFSPFTDQVKGSFKSSFQTAAWTTANASTVAQRTGGVGVLTAPPGSITIRMTRVAVGIAIPPTTVQVAN